MTIDDNKEALAMMHRALGSIENRIREAYNKGYHDGLKEGINQTTKKLVDKILEEVEPKRKTEPQTENPCDGCVCDDGKHLMYCMNCKGIAWKTEPPKVEPEPQTERDGE